MNFCFSGLEERIRRVYERTEAVEGNCRPAERPPHPLLFIVLSVKISGMTEVSVPISQAPHRFKSHNCQTLKVPHVFKQMEP